MVKNKKGGRSHKKMSSKDSKSTERTTKLILPRVEDEMIASVTQQYGHGHVNVMCNDGVERLCVIRKKFRGRHKRDNQIILNSLIMIGIRSYEVVAVGKKPKCDLLYVYSNEQKKELKRGGHVHACLLTKDGQADTDVGGFDIREGGGGGEIIPDVEEELDFDDI